MPRVTVLAATGRLGTSLVERLRRNGHRVIAVGRDAGKLSDMPSEVELRLADLSDDQSLTAALEDASLVVSCANAVHVPAVLAALPPHRLDRLVLMGSTRCYSEVPDGTAQAVRDAETALAALPTPSVMLLATMIYGAGAGVVESIANQMRRFRIMPLPDGPRVQPIHIDDVAACLEAALFRPDALGEPIVIAGPAPLTYPEMASMIAARRGLRATILPLPAAAARVAGRMIGGGVGRGVGDALRRLAEDKAFDITQMRQRLGIEPRAFQP